ncbi:MAG: hypothetical protein O6950_09365 [Gammaproteobacteria bacterium]|nr:hypothetical protein [Gammaproteobacteria bacterium]
MRALKALDNPGRTNPAPPNNEDIPPSRSKFAAAYGWGFRAVIRANDPDAVESKLRAALEARGHLKTEEDRGEFKACFEAGVEAGFDARYNAAPLAEVGPREDEPPRTPAEPQEQRLTPIIGIDTEWVRDGPDHNRILSYQYAARAGGKEWSGIVYPKEPDKRITLGELLGRAIAHGTREHLISKWPDQVIVTAHWTRADLSAFKDFPTFKSQIDNVQKTYATTTKPFTASCTSNKRLRRFSVTMIDTQLLVPGSSKPLAALGKLHGYEKLDPGEKVIEDRSGGSPRTIKYIEHMDMLLEDDPELFKKYAIRDAEISALHVEKMWEFAQTELGVNKVFPTIGSMAVKLLWNIWQCKGVEPGAVLGYEAVREKQYDPKRRRYRTVGRKRWLPSYEHHKALSTQAYHGGRNEYFRFGPTAEGDWYEHDLTSAYVTAMAALRVPDYRKAHTTTDPHDFRPETLGFAHIRFRFPAHTLFPCLPVLAPHNRGLIYPLEGETVVPAPEMALALCMGAEIEIHHGVIVPWADCDVRPFEEVIREVNQRRARYEKGTVYNELWKQVGNSLYGKLGQAVNERRVFNTRTGQNEPIPPSKITCPFLAALVTGLTRAVMSELLIGVPPYRSVVGVTTDALMTNAALHELDQSGPLCTLFGDLRERLTGERQILETKYHVAQLLPWKARGVATLKTVDGGKPKLARGGVRVPRGVDSSNDWMVEKFLNRRPGDTWETEQPLSFPKAHETNADHVFQVVERRFNFEYDYKRELVDPVLRATPMNGADGEGISHIACGSRPWQTLADFTRVRDMFDEWRHRHAGQLKTLDDWKAWSEYQAGESASKKGVRRSQRGVADQARRTFLRAYTRGWWGLPGGQYKAVAGWLTSAGYPTSENDLKNAKRASDPVERAIPANAPGIADFVRTILDHFPNFEWHRLVDGEVRGLHEFPQVMAA